MLEFNSDFVVSVDVGSLCAVSLKKQLGRLHLLPMYTAPKLPLPILLCSRYLPATRKSYYR